MRLTVAVFGLAVLALSGCTGRFLMPTPNLYINSAMDPFRDVPIELRSNTVDVLYLTDRQPEMDDSGNLQYGYKRSYSLAWGIATVALGRDLAWAELVELSRSKERQREPRLELISVNELGRGPATPYPSTIDQGFVHIDATVNADRKRALDDFYRVLADRLEYTPRKDVYFYVHGYNDTFEGAASTLAELWHFNQRQGVPIIYTWPAGSPGLLRGYVYDRESSEFTVHHLKEAIRAVSNVSEVERIHVIAHSRGTDIALSAIRELLIEAWAKGSSPQQEYRIGSLVLAAADLDNQVLGQRVLGANIHAGVSQLVLYTSRHDRALGVASFLFSSPRGRAGRLHVSTLTENAKTVIERSNWDESLSIINLDEVYRGAGHSYFRTSPEVSSDLLLLLNGVEPGTSSRPLKPLGFLFWHLPAGYPGNLSE